MAFSLIIRQAGRNHTLLTSYGKTSKFSTWCSNLSKKLRIGLIRETKVPHDSRVLFTPNQCREILDKYPNVSIKVQSSKSRCFSDTDFESAGLEVGHNVEDCDVLCGIKEVTCDTIIPNKSYFFFSHTIKMQSYNRELLQQMLERGNRLIDYECLVGGTGRRVTAFGRWAGIVGGHNTILCYGERTGRFHLSRLNQLKSFDAARNEYATNLNLKGVRILVTGTGRVGQGLTDVLDAMGVQRVTSQEFLARSASNYSNGSYVQLKTCELFGRNTNGQFDQRFYKDPLLFRSIIGPYLSCADVFMNGIFWDCRGPPLFTVEDMRRSMFKIHVIGDITCDIAPVASIPCTLRATTIADPILGFDPHTGMEVPPHTDGAVDVMAVGNLPNELPREASRDFGNQFMYNVLPELLQRHSPMLYRATITCDGRLNGPYEYLENFVEEDGEDVQIVG